MSKVLAGTVMYLVYDVSKPTAYCSEASCIDTCVFVLQPQWVVPFSSISLLQGALKHRHAP